MRLLGDVFLGDLVLAISRLKASEADALNSIATLLGFRAEGELAPVPDVTEIADEGTPTQDDRVEPGESVPLEPLSPGVMPDQQEHVETERLDLGEEVVDFEFEESLGPTPSAPEPSPTWPSGPVTERAAPTDQLTLFEPNWTPSILGEALATFREDRLPDVTAAVEIIARCGDLSRLPLGRRSTLFRGCEVLCDVGRGMEPYIEDRWQLIDDLISLVGRELISTLFFEDCPTYGVDKAEPFDGVRYEPPLDGKQVIIISDLGIASPPFSRRGSTWLDWLRFCGDLKRAGCRAVVFVPYPPSRWPPLMAEMLSVVQWDRCTTSLAVRCAKYRD